MKTQIKPGSFQNRWMYFAAIFLLLVLVLADFGAIGQAADADYWIIPENRPDEVITGIVMLSGSQTYLSARTGNVYLSTNFTNNYEVVFSAAEGLNGIDIANSNYIVVGDNGFAARSSDGITWSTVDFNQTVSEALSSVKIVDNHVWIVGEGGTILYSNSSGDSWVRQASPQNRALNDLDFADNSTGWIVGENGLILRTTNAGTTWTPVNSGTTQDLNGVDVETSSSDRLWVVGDGGLFFISFGTGFGTSFDTINSRTSADLYDVYSPKFNVVWAAGAEGTILGYRGNEVKNDQILEDEGSDAIFYAIYAINNDAVVGGTDIYFNRVGLIPEFSTERDWNDIIFFTKEVVPLLLGGLWAALQVIIFSLIIGFLIGLMMASMRTISNRVLNIFATTYSDLFRNTPLLVQLFFISFGLPELGVNPPVFIDAVIALSLNTGAYQSEIIRSGILAIPKGQMEAARSLGMTNMEAMRHVILPQAVRITIPPLSNEAVIMFLNTAQLSVIAYEEITRIGQLIATTTFLWSRTFLYVALTYFVITYSITQLLRRAESKLKIPGLGGGEI